MSDGGLLEKAMDSQTNADDLVAAVISEPPQDNSMSPTKILSILVIGLLIPMLILMWFGVYIDVIPITLLSPLVILASLVFVWWKLDVGLPHIAGGSGINTTRAGVVFVTFIILVGTPTLLSLALTGDMSLGDVEFNDEGSEMSIKIRQNGGSGNHVATVSITQSDSVLWIYNVPFSIDSSDGQGDYGKFTIAVEDFYSANALPHDSTEYELTVSVGDETFSKTLDSNYLTRTITDSKSSSTASLTNDCDNKERCLKGVALTGSAGLAASAGYPPAGMPFADYTMKVTMYYTDSDESTSMVIDYPIITVDNTAASWDSNGGEWGSGSGIVGDEGSSLSLGGSEFASDIQADIIPRSAWENGGEDYGCYTVSIEINQQSPWAGLGGPVTSESHYMFEKTGNPADGESETWTSVDSCPA